LLSPITKLLTAIKQRGIKGTIVQLYLIGDLKFGELKGIDKHGNKYYENPQLPYGQHRWIEYADIHNPDASMIHPDWHGWMHHVYDNTPKEAPIGVQDTSKAHALASQVHSIYDHNVGFHKEADQEVQHNTSSYRRRGYGVGSLMSGPEGDNYYLQPGHPLHPLSSKGGRFESSNRIDEWTPEGGFSEPTRESIIEQRRALKAAKAAKTAAH